MSASVVFASWVPTTPMYFWECSECDCAFGALELDRWRAERGAKEHNTSVHGKEGDE